MSNTKSRLLPRWALISARTRSTLSASIGVASFLHGRRPATRTLPFPSSGRVRPALPIWRTNGWPKFAQTNSGKPTAQRLARTSKGGPTMPRPAFSGVNVAAAIAQRCFGEDPPRACGVGGFIPPQLEARVKMPKGGNPTVYGLQHAPKVAEALGAEK
jgi:hypothetical protein